MVIFRSTDGKPGYRQADSIADAISIVEQLLNEENAESVRIYRMEEVAFEFKVRYQVALADGIEEAEAAPEPEPKTKAEPEISGGETASSEADTPTLRSTPLFDQQRAAINPDKAPAWVEDTLEEAEADAEAREETTEETTDTEGAPRKGLFGR